MNLNIKKIGVRLLKDKEAGYLKKINEICRFMKDSCSNGVGELEFGKTTSHHQNGQIYYTKVRVSFSGKEFFIEKNAESIDAAFNLMKDRLEEEIRRYKDRIISDKRRGGKVKKELQGIV